VATAGPTRGVALDRMTQALEAAKRARDHGMNVQEARQALKQARSAFERGDYVAAMERADYILGRFAPGSVAVPAVSTPSSTSKENATSRLAQAAETVRQAKAHGFNVQVAKAALKQAKRALRAGDLQGAVDFADQAVQLSGSTGRVRP
jgi:phage-related protein